MTAVALKMTELQALLAGLTEDAREVDAAPAQGLIDAAERAGFSAGIRYAVDAIRVDWLAAALDEGGGG